jgi:tetratricopeptide (TPR) repeat protein
MARLGEGLAHAHERGILHRDLKPANILFSEDGQPMLLDFNLAVDASENSLGQVGGTIPYMAPEHIQAFLDRTTTVDARADLYGLGIIFYEFLTGRRPFEINSLERSRFSEMIRERTQPPPKVRSFNRAVPPAVESIVRKLLQPNPDHRYQSARDLVEDLERELVHLPLKHASNPSVRELARKFTQRHPRLFPLTIAITAFLFSVVLLGMLRNESRTNSTLEAVNLRNEFLSVSPALQMELNVQSDKERRERAIFQTQYRLAKYGVLDDPNWQQRPSLASLPEHERTRVREEIGLLLVQLARNVVGFSGSTSDPEAVATGARLNQLAEGCFGTDRVPSFLKHQREWLTSLQEQGASASASPVANAFSDDSLRTGQDYFLVGSEYLATGRTRDAIEYLRKATHLQPNNPAAQFALAWAYQTQGQFERALERYQFVVSLYPEDHRAYFNQGTIHLSQGRYEKACESFDLALERAPNDGDSLKHRGLVRVRLAQVYRQNPTKKELSDKLLLNAVDDYSRSLELKFTPIQVYFLRAQAFDLLGEKTKAEADRANAAKLTPGTETDFLVRGSSRLTSNPINVAGALSDFQEAERLNPGSLRAIHNQAHVLSEHLQRPEEALARLDAALKMFPESAATLGGRAVLLARLGKRTEAHKTAEYCLTLQQDAKVHYQIAGVFALCAKDHPEDARRALAHLQRAIQLGFADLAQLEKDHDLDPIRPTADFRELISSFKKLYQTRH